MVFIDAPGINPSTPSEIVKYTNTLIDIADLVLFFVNEKVEYNMGLLLDHVDKYLMLSKVVFITGKIDLLITKNAFV